MGQLLLSETYMLLLLNAVGDHTDIRLPQYSAGIVLGGIRDLLEAGCITVRPGGTLEASAPLPDGYSGVTDLFRDLEERTETAGRWLDLYCCSPSSEKVNALLDAMYASLAEKKLIDIEIRRGIFRRKKIVSMRPPAARVVEEFLRDAGNPRPDSGTAFCIQMLQLAEVLKVYFPRSVKVKLRTVLRVCEREEIWGQMEPYVNRIRNFNYQNAVNFGAVYQ